MAKPYDYIMKILLIGDSSVGKPQILLAYAEEHFSSNFISTAGIDFKLKNIELAGKKIKLQIWDTAGQERFRSITTAYFRGAMGIMLVYDITNKTSFQNVELWLKQIKQYAQENTQVILVGNKCDLNHLRQVQKDEGEKIAASYGIKFMEVSAKKRINIDEAFLTLAEDILAVLSKQVTEEHLGHLAGNKAPRDSESGKDKSIFKRLFQPFIVGMAQAATSVPEEIQQDPYALDLYERALRDGTEKDRSIRINIVGNYRQGKTSLMRRLLGQKVSDVSSTNGIDVIHYKCMRTSDGKLSFRRAEEKDKSDIVERLLSVALAPKHEQHEDVPGTTNTEIRMSEPKLGAVTNTPQTQKSDFPESADLNKDEEISLYTEHLQKGNTNAFDVDKASSGNIEATKRGKNESKKSVLSATEKETFTRELSKRKVQTSTKETQTLFDMWDFGGQHIFYATHTLFHSENAIYLLVFDLTLALDTVIVDEDFPEESSNKDMEYFLHFWMNSIHSFVGSVDGSRPKVILVGTHKDKVKGNAKAKRHYIEQYFSKIRTSFDGTKLLNHIHSEDFSVDNSIGNDDAVFQLRETIISLGNAQSKTIEIPAKWIQLEKALTDRKHIKIIPFELVLAIDEQNEVPVGDPEEIKLFLRYHHSKGTYIYFEEEPLSQHVVLEPQYLIDAFKCIITTERFCTNDPEIRPLWKMLQTDGRLEEALIDRQWGKDMDKMFMEHKYILISFLIKYNIISEATDFDDRTQRLLRLGWFVVPSLLKANLPHTEIRQFLNRKKQTIVKFVMFFDNSTIVPTIYHRLMAALIGKWPVAQLGKKALISKDKCVVRLNMDHAGIGEMKFDTIELTVVNLCPSSAIFPEQADIFRRFSEALIIHEFSKLGRKHEYHRKPYSTWYRCNHESHDDKGSMKIAEIATLNDEKLIPCPDLISHDIDARKAEQEWFLDHRTNLATSNSELNDKVLSKMSTCIGKNWQLLGLELGVAQVQIEQISEDYPNSTAMRIYNMLKFWRLHTTDSANFNVLVEAMQNCPQVSIHWDGIRNIVDGMN